MKRKTNCPECNGSNLYETQQVGAGGGYAPNYLPGLGTMIKSAKFNVITCGDCGLTRLFARPEAIEKLESSDKWRRIY